MAAATPRRGAWRRVHLWLDHGAGKIAAVIGFLRARTAQRAVIMPQGEPGRMLCFIANGTIEAALANSRDRLAVALFSANSSSIIS